MRCVACGHDAFHAAVQGCLEPVHVPEHVPDSEVTVSIRGCGCKERPCE